MTRTTSSKTSALLDVYPRLDIEPVRGQGSRLFTKDGREFIDFYGGHAVALLGYAHPRLLEALERQARDLFFQSNLMPLAVRERAAERLAAFGPTGLTKVFFVNSGAEANENALRIAIRATGRRTIVAVEGGFHGRTAAAGAVSAGHETWYGFPAAPFETRVVPFDDGTALDAAIDTDTAAVIFEPVQGIAGARALSRSFVAKAREMTRARGAVLILDEVQCGMGRTGFPFAAQAYGVTPDLLTTAKGLAGGFPAGAVLMSDALAGAVGRNDLGSTFGGGPMAMALVETVIDVIETEGLLDRVRRLSQRLMEETLGGPVAAVQGMGFLLGLRTHGPAERVNARLRERGILAGGSNDPAIVRLLPPLVLEDADVDRLVGALQEIAG